MADDLNLASQDMFPSMTLGMQNGIRIHADKIIILLIPVLPFLDNQDIIFHTYRRKFISIIIKV